MSFWDVLWFICISYLFIAYIMLLFAIFGDLFRDHETSGFAKALWSFALIFVPFLSMLIYLIVRGQGMTERAHKSAEAAQREQESYIKTVAGGGPSPADQIAQATKLLDEGSITREEYDKLKEKALA